ncbi:MAG: PQQ-binding-like beta-propeller repeat protein [Spartobacteria bacterium]
MNKINSRICKNRVVLLALLVLCYLVTGAWLLASDWPIFRNISNAGASSETINLPLTEVWHSTAPAVEENGVVVANGIAYMMSQTGNLYAFTVSSGFDVAGFPVQASQTYGTPAVDTANGRIYVIAGNQLWAFKLDGTPAFPTITVGFTGNNYSEGPILDGGFVYFQAGGLLQKYDSSGAAQWTSASTGDNTQPAISGGFVYKNTESGQIRKYDKVTGVEVLGGGFPIATTSSQASLAVVNGRIFHKTDELRVYDATTGAALWNQPIGGSSTYYSSPALANGAVYVYGWDSRLYAFNESTGAALAGFPSVALATDQSGNYSSPSVAGDKVFVAAGRSQKLKVIGAAGSAQAGMVLEEHLTFSSDTQGFDLCSPAISGGYVFAMLDGGGLYAFFAGSNPPSGGLQINGGAECTISREVTLTVANNDNPNVTEMRISEDPFFGGASFVPYQKMVSFTLSDGFGTKTVYAQLRDNARNLSNVFSDSINYQETCGGGGGGGGVCDVVYGPGPASRYYITAGQQGKAWVTQLDSVINSWVLHFPINPGQYAISVLDKVRISGSFLEGVTRIGSEYSTDGVYTGKDFPYAIPGAGFWDGATDGLSNYSVDYEYGGVYKFDLDWSNPALVFDTPVHYLGITFDPQTQTLWLAQWENGVVEHRSLDGTVLSSFEVPFNRISCLALDPADGSLWMGSQGELGKFYQYSPCGRQVSTRTYASLADQNTLGGEFPMPSASATPPPAPTAKPTVTVSASPSRVNEGSDASFRITRSVPSTKSLLVMYFMVGNATLGSDYTLTQKLGRATIPAGATSTTVILHAIADHVPEKTEAAIMTLSAAPSYKLGRVRKATINILNTP